MRVIPYFYNIPEYLLILAILFYWMSAGLVINYIAIALLSVLIYQIVSKNKVLGLVIPIVLMLCCFYMILALFSELREFPSFNSDAKLMLAVGLTYFIGTICVSSVMIYKYTMVMSKNIK